MLEIFITVVAAVVVGGIILEFWRPILVFTITSVVVIISLIIHIPMFIIVLLEDLSIARTSDEELEEMIVQCYDKMLHEASSKEELSKKRNTIAGLQTILQRRKKKRDDKQVAKMLEEVKWVL